MTALPTKIEELTALSVEELIPLRAGMYTVAKKDGTFRKSSLGISDYTLKGCRNGKKDLILMFEPPDSFRDPSISHVEIPLSKLDNHTAGVAKVEYLAQALMGDMTGPYTPKDLLDDLPKPEPKKASFDHYDESLAGIF